jgi:hypothetical protein
LKKRCLLVCEVVLTVAALEVLLFFENFVAVFVAFNVTDDAVVLLIASEEPLLLVSETPWLLFVSVF